MRRRVSAEHLKRAKSLTSLHDELGTREVGSWNVCDEYELRNDEIVAKYTTVYPEGRFTWNRYSPLEDTPDLFLKLVAMHEAPDFTEAALDFSHMYGVLGDNSLPVRRAPEKTSLSSWKKEAERAWVILKLYEAALNFDGKAVKILHSEHLNGVLEGVRQGNPDYETDPEGNVRAARDALGDVADLVHRTVSRLCRPGIGTYSYNGYFKIGSSWGFDNLLGAMYLQMYWLITSGDDLGRCEDCGRIISFARTYPEGRKRRRDKRFCNDACRQAHHRSKRKS